MIQAAPAKALLVHEEPIVELSATTAVPLSTAAVVVWAPTGAQICGTSPLGNPGPTLRFLLAGSAVLAFSHHIAAISDKFAANAGTNVLAAAHAFAQ